MRMPDHQTQSTGPVLFLYGSKRCRLSEMLHLLTQQATAAYLRCIPPRDHMNTILQEITCTYFAMNAVEKRLY
jgi:hypothetical protein